MKGLIKLTMISLGLLCINLSINAQVSPGAFGYYNDALRYSQAYNFGTARTAGLAGSGLALGGDIGAIGINPAGLGLFNRSQFVLTPTISLNKGNTTFLGGDTPTEEANLDIGNLGIVINFSKGKLSPSGWSSGSLAITYNRINDFRRSAFFRGQNDNNSIIDAMLEQANGLFPEELTGLAQIGYDHYLINPIPGAEDTYDSFVLGFPEQVEAITREGFTDEIKIAYGTNYKDLLYLGAGVGFTNTEYTYTRIFTELFDDPAIAGINIDERLDVNGTGVNLNLGFIVRPADFVRVGASYTSPTWYNFNEESDVFYTTQYNDFDVSTWAPNGQRIIQEDTVLGTLNSNTPLFISEYDLRTPARINAGVALFFKKHGFITADIERLDYTNAHVSSSDFFADADNTTIDRLYQSVTNIKLGAEFRYNFLRLRGGYATLGDPFVDGFDDLDRSRTVTSFGLGLNFGKYFVDLSHTQTSFEESFASYTLANNANPVALTDNDLRSTRITLGINF